VVSVVSSATARLGEQGVASRAAEREAPSIFV